MSVFSLTSTTRTFRFLPEFFHLIECRLIKCAPARFESLFDVAEAATEFAVGELQSGFGFDAEVARNVGDGEEQVAQLFTDALVFRLFIGGGARGRFAA